MYEWIQWLHLAAGIVWLGGMTLLLWAVRPAAIALLPPEQRLPLLHRVLSRFFVLVWLAIAVLLATGLWMFGSEIERLWGHKRYLQFIVASVLSAAIVQLLWGVLTAHNQPTVGASGALFGLLLAFGMMFPNRIIMPLFPPIPMKAKVFVAVFGGLELLFGLGGSSGVAHFAHLGGMLGGWLMMRYWRGQPPFGAKGGQRRR